MSIRNWSTENEGYAFSNFDGDANVSENSQGKLAPFFNIGNNNGSFPITGPICKRFTCQVNSLSDYSDAGMLLDMNTEDLYRFESCTDVYPVYERPYGTSQIDPVKGIPVRFQKIEFCSPDTSGYFYALAGNPVEYYGMEEGTEGECLNRSMEDNAQVTDWANSQKTEGIRLTHGCDYIKDYNSECPITGEVDRGILSLGLAATFNPFPVPAGTTEIDEDGNKTFTPELNSDGSAPKNVWKYPGIDYKNTDGYCEYQFLLKKIAPYDECISIIETEEELQIQNNQQFYINSDLICSESDLNCTKTYNFYSIGSENGITISKSEGTCEMTIGLDADNLPYNPYIDAGRCIDIVDLGNKHSRIDNTMTIVGHSAIGVMFDEANCKYHLSAPVVTGGYGINVYHGNTNATGTNGQSMGIWDRCVDNPKNIVYKDGRVIVGDGCGSLLDSPKSVLNVFGNIHLKEYIVDNVGEDASNFNGVGRGGTYPVLTVTGGLLKWDAWEVKRITLCEGSSTTDYDILVKPVS